ncbi:MAG: helix-turn-helix domain-containing protein [Comamonadaceae bacterium]|nr:helix-turn-helix domain-containing protein [Comamonadaceae bacterium]
MLPESDLPELPPSSKSRSSREKTSKTSPLFIASTEKSFQVLESFGGSQRQMSLAEIARIAGLDRSAAQRVVFTLETLGYLARVPESRSYELTAKVLHLSYDYLRANEIVNKASPYLLEVSRNTGETSNLQGLQDSEIVFLARFHGRYLVNIDFAVGARLPAMYTASGIAIMGRLPVEQRQVILKQTVLTPMTPQTETDPERLLARIAEMADQGYAVVANETLMGDIAVAAPITDHRGNAVAAISIAAPTTRWTVERAIAELAPQVVVAATSISGVKSSRL